MRAVKFVFLFVMGTFNFSVFSMKSKVYCDCCYKNENQLCSCGYMQIDLFQPQYPFFIDANGQSALHKAAKKGDLKRLEKSFALIEQYEKVKSWYKKNFINQLDKNGFSALHYAFDYAFHTKNFSVIKVFLFYGADINIEDSCKKTVLDYGICCGDPNLIGFLYIKMDKSNKKKMRNLLSLMHKNNKYYRDDRVTEKTEGTEETDEN
jgi:hypothetical protein